MKVFGTIVKIMTALAAVIGAAYVTVTYGDQIVAWVKKQWDRIGGCCCCCCDEDCCCDEEDCCCEDCCCEEQTEEAPQEEAAPAAGEEDFAE